MSIGTSASHNAREALIGLFVLDFPVKEEFRIARKVIGLPPEQTLTRPFLPAAVRFFSSLCLSAQSDCRIG
jgi:hypothetical protein